MSPELDKLLVERYPSIFRDRNGNIKESCMPFGFECGDGWFNILNQLCSTIEHRSKHSDCDQVIATQVKEKFGTLRFYFNGGDDYIDGAVELAEMLSSVTCEKCGSPAKTENSGGWLSTSCGNHT